MSEENVAHWDETEDENGSLYCCSSCHYLTVSKTHYCPGCGAKMEAEDGKND